MSKISPWAFVDPSAQIGEDCEIGPFCFIDKNVVLGNGNKLMNGVTIHYGARIGDGNTFFPGSSISTQPQDLKFKGEDTVCIIGNDNSIRENVTISRGTASKGKTVLGSNNLLMESMHIGHDCVVGNGCIIGNSTKLAGEVIVDDSAIISANVLVHQFCRIGGICMIQGGSRTSRNIPPYIIAAREPICFSGINTVGLRRRGFTLEQIEAIQAAYRIIYLSGLNTTNALNKVEEELAITPEIQYILDFIKESKRGIIPTNN